MTHPTTIGECLRDLAGILKKADQIQARLKPLQDAEKALREHLLTTFKKTELSGARGSGLALSVVHASVPNIADWDAFMAFARKKGNDDLLNRKVTAEAWRERLEAGVKVPGVVPFERVSIRVDRAKK